MPVRLDLHNPVFHEQLMALAKAERGAVLRCCARVAAMEWNDILKDKDLRWEAIQSRGAGGERLYSIFVTATVRAVVKRSGDFLEFLIVVRGAA